MHLLTVPGQQGDAASPQGHDGSRNMILRLRRQRSITALVDSTLLTFQDPATDGAPHRVEVTHHWGSIAMSATKDMLNSAMGYVEPPPELPVYDITLGPGEVPFRARVELPHSRKKSTIRIIDVDTGEKVEGAAVLPKSLADRLSNISRQCLAPNTRHKTIYVDGNGLELCGLFRATCAFPNCYYFDSGRTYRWYWVIVNDEKNVLEECAFIPHNLGPRGERTLLPTSTGIVAFPS